MLKTRFLMYQGPEHLVFEVILLNAIQKSFISDADMYTMNISEFRLSYKQEPTWLRNQPEAAHNKFM